MAFQKATRASVPLIMSVTSVSGGGKTYTALLLAAGLAGPNGRVGFIDTENGRGRLYADSPGIRAALPNGYEIDSLDAPFTPAAYRTKIEEAEKAGIDVLVVDSFTHEWEGIGGCTDIAENNKRGGMPNWALAKREHKRLMYHLLSTKMHIILCIRARDKVKIEKRNGKDEVIPIGLQPITEKNVIFEALLSVLLDEKTHYAEPLKVPEMLMHLFPKGGRLLTKADGEAIRQWNETGCQLDPNEQIKKRARAAAEDGVDAYKALFASLTTAQKQALIDCGAHEVNKAAAAEADAAESSDAKEPA